MKDPRAIILAPVVSEKSYALIEETNTYTFRVHPSATKTQVRQAVETIFSVHVERVNTLRREGKRKRNRRNFKWGSQVTRKHAMVQLRKGDSIGIFEGA